MMKIKSIIYLLIIVTMASCATEKDYIVTIKTEYGDMKVILFDETPLHKKSFIELAQKGSYDSTIFHRVIPEFMVQGGDINRKEDGEKNMSLIDAEFRPDLIHTKGMLAAARTGDNVNPQKRSGTQFYIVQGKKYTREELDKYIEDEYFGNCVNGLQQLFQQNKYRDLMNELIQYQNSGDMDTFRQKVYESTDILDNEGLSVTKKDYTDAQFEAYEEVGGTPFLDGAYTVFGQVLQGIEVVDSIAAQPTNPGDAPVNNIYMTMEVEEISKAKISKEYGFDFPEEK